MSNSIEFQGPDGNDGPFLLASGGGWTNFCEWVLSLPDRYKTLRLLVNDGEAKDTLSLGNELKECLDKYGSGIDPNTKDVVDHLIESIGVGDTYETAIIN